LLCFYYKNILIKEVLVKYSTTIHIFWHYTETKQLKLNGLFQTVAVNPLQTYLAENKLIAGQKGAQQAAL